MKCNVCGSELKYSVNDLPFKVHQQSIVIIKGIPLWQCENCSEYEIEDKVMEGIDALLKNIDSKVEIEILSYAA